MKLYEFAEKVHAAKAQAFSANLPFTSLFLGELDAPTPAAIVRAGRLSLQNGRTKYGSAYGETPLRQAIAADHDVPLERVIITPGSKFAIFAIIRELAGAKPKDGRPAGRVVTIYPHWPGFAAICGELGVELTLVRTTLENGWVPSEKEVEDALLSVNGSAARLLILCNPSNPTSTILPAKTVSKLIALARAKGVPVLLDEAYKHLAFKTLKTPADPNDDGVIIAGSFSKRLAMTGWRCGYLVAPPALDHKLAGLAQSSYSCVPPFVQDAALAGLSKPGIPRKFAREFKARAEAAARVLAEAGWEVVPPQAGFYAFARKKGLDSDAFVMSLLSKENIAIAPGTAFGYPEFLRISLSLPVAELEKTLAKVVSHAP
jgi:aspartate aminotransferase